MASSNSDGETTARGSGVDCVFVSCFEHDFLFFASMLCPGGIRLHHADTLEMADFLLVASRGTVLLTDTTFLDGSWEDALAMTGRAHAQVATLIYADQVDHEFIVGAQERGAFDVLWRPIGLARLRSSIWTAHEATVERRLWSTARVHERPRNQHPAPGSCLRPLS